MCVRVVENAQPNSIFGLCLSSLSYFKPAQFKKTLIYVSTDSGSVIDILWLNMKAVFPFRQVKSI